MRWTVRRTPDPPASPFRLTLGELMLWIALVAACLGAASNSTILGVIAALALVPILGRASRIVRRRTALGRPVDASTWMVAILGSVGPVLRTWALTAIAYLAVSLAATLLIARSLAIFPGLQPAAWPGFHVVVAIATLGACATFSTSAIHSWAIREREVGRIPGPSPRRPAAGENPAGADSRE